MAVIFFDGFNDSANRAVNTNHWTFTGASLVSSRARILESTDATNNIKLGNIGTHTGKKIYLGLRYGGWAGAPNNATQSFVRFYDSADALVLDLRWNLQAIVSPNVGLSVFQNNTLNTTYTILNSIAVTERSFDNGTTDNFFDSNRRLLEFEIDIANGTVGMRYEGQTILNSSNNATTTLTTALGNIAAIQIYGPANINGSTGVDVEDMYLLDDTGTFANTWLGTSFAVHSPTWANDNPVANEWNTSASSTFGNVVLNTNDGDSSYINTGGLNRFQIYPLNNISPGGLSPVVGAIRCEAVARRPTLNAAYKYACRVGTTNYEMGDATSLTSDVYSLQPVRIIHTNPATNAQWTVTAVNDAAFGVRSVPTP